MTPASCSSSLKYQLRTCTPAGPSNTSCRRTNIWRRVLYNRERLNAQSLYFQSISSMDSNVCASGDGGPFSIHSLEMSLLLIAAVQVAFVFGMTAAPRTAIYIQVISEQHCARIWAALCAHQSNPSASLRGKLLLKDKKNAFQATTPKRKVVYWYERHQLAGRWLKCSQTWIYNHDKNGMEEDKLKKSGSWL